jgi:hypothetical protein
MPLPGSTSIRDALSSVPEVQFFMGTFLTSEKFAGLMHPPEFRPPLTLQPPWPDVAKVIKTEEKGSDVNLASHLLFDAFKGDHEVAAVLSNDSDLVEPIRLVTKEPGRPVGLLSPVSNPNPHLRQAATFMRRIDTNDVAACQFPDVVHPSDGRKVARPGSWR